jgi:hypothetical protein
VGKVKKEKDKEKKEKRKGKVVESTGRLETRQVDK